MSPCTFSLSVIVCTFNRSRLLEKCLTSLMTQESPPGKRYEVIVVDNNSTDDTQAIVSRIAAGYRHIVYVKEDRQGLSYARNKGAEVARGEYLAYLDDDSMAPEGYLNNLLEVIDKYQPDIIGGPIFPYYDSSRPRWFKDRYELRNFAERSGFSTSCRVSGGNFIIRRELLFNLGGFNVNLGMKGNQIGLGEERAVLEDYRRRIPHESQKVYYSLECSVLHYVPHYKMKRSYMLKRSYQVGRVAARIKNKEPSSFFRRMFSFFPNLFSIFFETLKKDGIFKADYFGVVIQGALRIGTMAELLSHGMGPVVNPHINLAYKRLRSLIKKTGMGSLFLWIESRFRKKH